ncbi:MAG TPA: hypothetical protein VJ417_02415, partial [Candidatus Glassbacteria bacterium]|nr:hypothetical protein [Candidatus Glassbacteria bacterium]
MTQYPLRGNGDGTLAEPPLYLSPIATFEFEPVNPERLTTEKKLYVDVVSDFRGIGTANNNSELSFRLLEGSTLVQETGKTPVRVRNGAFNYSTVFSGPVDNQGASYALSASFDYMSNGDFRTKVMKSINAGGYTGATLIMDSNQTNDNQPGGYPPAVPIQLRDGRFTVTWQAGMTVTVVDQTRGYTLPFVEFPDAGYGWGFVTRAAFGTAWTGTGALYTDMHNNKPFSQRTVKMVNTIPADNTAEFGIWLNGNLFVLRGASNAIASMPTAGTVFTIDMAFGAWNSDRTVFTQEAAPPFPGDRWEFTIKPTTLQDEDADLTK